MFRPSESIASEIDAITAHNRELVRMNRHAEEDIATRRKLMNINATKLERLFEAKATSERKEVWLTLPRVVWAMTPDWYGTKKDCRIISVSAKQIRVGAFESGVASLYKLDGNPWGRSTNSAIDIEKTFPEGLPK